LLCDLPLGREIKGGINIISKEDEVISILKTYMGVTCACEIVK